MSSTFTTNLNLRKPSHRDPDTLETWDYVLNNDFDLIDASFGLRSYTEQNYIVNTDSHSMSLDKLDMKLFDVASLAPTADQKAALTGPVGYIPNAGNPYVTVSYAVGGFPISRKLVLAPEYAGGVLWNGGAVPVSGTLTTDYELAATYGYNFYKWLSSAVAFEAYNVVVRWKVPETFKAFNAIVNKALIIDICTQETAITNNKVGATIFRDDGLGITSVFAPIASTAPATWYSERAGNDTGAIHFDATNVVLASLVAGNVLVIQISMLSQISKYVKIGDITLQYTG